MEMGDDEECVVHLEIEGDGGEHHAGQAAQHEDEDEAEDEVHGGGHANAAGPEGREPAENLNAAGDGDHHAGRGEIRFADLRQARGEHVVHPKAEAQ